MATASQVATSQTVVPSRSLSVVRLGGLVGLAAGILAITLNFVVLAPYPETDAPLASVASYLAENSAPLALSNTLRFATQFLLVVFGAALYEWLKGAGDGMSRFAARLGLLGVVWMVAVGVVGNSIELAMAWQADAAVEQPQFLLAGWSLGSVVFATVAITWGTVVLGFSLAGGYSRLLPRWFVGYGLTTSAVCLFGGIGIASVLEGGWATYPWFTGSILFLAWIFVVSVLMLRAARNRRA